MVGVDPHNNDPYEMMSRVRPDDLYRFGMGRTKLVSMEKDLYIAQKGQNLLCQGHHLSQRELEIIHLIEIGMSSKEIADKLFLSIHTVNTHRGNILIKTQKSHVSDLIYELKENGLL